jgi:hypothetical protein
MSFYDKIKVEEYDIKSILNNRYLDLNEFEAGFMESVYTQCKFRSAYYLSKKQKGVFDRILAKSYAADPGKDSVGEKYRTIFKRLNKKLSVIDSEHLAAYNHVYTENTNIKIGFELMLNKYGISIKEKK